MATAPASEAGGVTSSRGMSASLKSDAHSTL